jgi:hypothetical protein
MTFPRARLAVSAALFLVWLGYLLLLVVMSRHTVVLSRPQLLVAELCVLAELTGDGVPDDEVTIKGVYWSIHAGDETLKGKRVRVRNLVDAALQGYEQPGLYILALDHDDEKGQPVFAVTHVPYSPSFVPAFVNVIAVDAGADLERTAGLVQEFLGLDADEARQLLKRVKPHQPVVLKRNVPVDQANRLTARVLEDERGGKQKDVARIETRNNDVRIYPLTPETKDQIDALKKTR